MEIANNGYGPNSAVANLAQTLGSDWKYVNPNTTKLGTNAIAVAIIYNSKRVKTVGAVAIYDNLSQINRVTMAQTFQSVKGVKLFDL